MSSLITQFAVLSVILVSSSAYATTLNYGDFNSVAGLTLNGSAAKFSDRLRLVPEAYDQAGSAFSTTPIGLNNLSSFSTFFKFEISNPAFGMGDEDGPGADGLVFVVQTVDDQVGGGGGGMGYGGIYPSVGVEFDTYNNPPPYDDNGNHVGIDENGAIISIVQKHELTRFNNALPWYAWVDYKGASQIMEVRISQNSSRPASPFLSKDIDLAGILGSPDVYVGFTAGTGGGVGSHDILAWRFESTYKPIGTPDGGMTLSLLALGISVLEYLRRRANSTPV